ncbi:ParM/StbA family protein [Microaerobacter geothermalis]|uniref:ParM/StbA family protein n=1 Tax=Microaerobacter geothermalis TaxID=674972 RepID=UPI001F3ED3DC|nr:ParM/StbA family protein [Microaerobacter geothermalis]MCF6093901.1 ParM/StbA family protein [Microaerobacter geothermalis]
MHNRFLIAIDSGKHSTKAIMKEEEGLQRVKFRTLVEEVEDFGADISPNTDLVEFQGKSYLVGEMLDESKMDYRLTKHNLIHQICIYLAIAKLLQKSKRSIAFANICLATNIPLSLYRNDKQKKAYQEFIQNSGEPICKKVNGKAFVFRIHQIFVLPEGIGPVYSNINEFRHKRILIIDIGSLNVNFQEFTNLIPSFQQMITADLGVNLLRSKISDTLTSRYGTTISDNDVERLFRDKYLFLNGEKQEDSKEIIDGLIANHVKEIFNHARSRKISFNNTEVHFVGGGSLLLRDFILDEYPSSIIHTDAQFANTLSFLKILEAKQNG